MRTVDGIVVKVKSMNKKTNRRVKTKNKTNRGTKVGKVARYKSLKTQGDFLQEPLAELKTYPELLDAIKGRIRQSQVAASFAVNAHLVMLYWDIGAVINAKQSAEGWGSKVVDSLSMDLRRLFPGMTGFSVRNLGYMRAFAAALSRQVICASGTCKIDMVSQHNVS